MSEMRSALIKATRTLDAELALRDNLQPLRDALGEALDIEKFLDEQRAAKVQLEVEVANLQDSVALAKRTIDKDRADAEANAVAIRSAAESWAEDVREQAARKMAEAKSADERAKAALTSARTAADGIIAAAEDKAGKIAAGKTEELTSLDNQIAGKKSDLVNIQMQCTAAQTTLDGLNRELSRIKAGLPG